MSEVTNTDIRNEVNETLISHQSTINECKISNGIKNPFNNENKKSNSDEEEESKHKAYNESLRLDNRKIKSDINNSFSPKKKCNFSKSQRIAPINYQSDSSLNGHDIVVEPNIQKVLKKNKTDKGTKDLKKESQDKYQSLAKCFIGDEEDDS